MCIMGLSGAMLVHIIRVWICVRRTAYAHITTNFHRIKELKVDTKKELGRAIEMQVEVDV